MVFHLFHAHEENGPSQGPSSLQWCSCSITHGVGLERGMSRGQGTATMLLVSDLHEATCEDKTQCLCHDVKMRVKQCHIGEFPTSVSLQTEMK